MFSVISILEIQGEQNKTIAIPLLGAGDQQIDSKIIVPQLIDISLEFLKYSRHLNKIYFVVYSDDDAKEFNTVMNNSLGRNKLQTPKGELASILKNDLISTINKVLDGKLNNIILNDLKRVVNSDFRSFEFGAISRKAIEYILDDINPDSKKQFELIKKIDALNAKGVASWILSYLHLIRVFGNEAVHNKEQNSRKPEVVESKDLEIGLYCMIRILDFYSQSKIGF